MRTYLSLILLVLTISIKAQMVVSDPGAASLLSQIAAQQAVDNTKALMEAKNTVTQISNQYKFLTETVSKVENAVETLEAVNDVRRNSTGVVSDYSNCLNQLRTYRKLHPKYVNNQLIRLENIILTNQKTFAFLSSIITNDIMKMSSYERIKLIQEINTKIVNLRASIFNISRDASIKNQQALNKQGLYSIPILK